MVLPRNGPTMPDLVLTGCRTQPLSSYLKSLGVLRLVAEQADADASGWFSAEGFVLRSAFDFGELLGFLVDEYAPTPMVAPWNSGSGLGARDAVSSPTAAQAVEAIEASTVDRLRSYRQTISATRRIVADPRWGGLDKALQVELCRGELPDAVVPWVDAAVVLTADDRAFPPLLGTGGNDGRFDFSSNFMQRIGEMFGLARRPGKVSNPGDLARAALRASAGVRLDKVAIGQFDAFSASGIGSSPDGSADSLVNPWDFILLLEGALMFASSATRRLSGSAAASMPFIVRPSAVGHPTAASSEASRGELWAPVWSRPASAAEVRRFFNEGRVEFAGRQAVTGLDAALAIADLGVERGIDRFVRYSFVERNGLSTVAVPVDEVHVSRRAGCSVGWLDVLHSRTRLLRGGTPPSVASRMRAMDEAQYGFAVSRRSEAAQEVLAQWAGATRAALRSRAASEKVRQHPAVRAVELVEAVNDGSDEVVLAACLASARSFSGAQGDLARVLCAEPSGLRGPRVDGFGVRSLGDVLAEAWFRLAVLRTSDDGSARPLDTIYGLACPTAVLARYLSGDLDEAKLVKVLDGFMLLDWFGAEPLKRVSSARHPLPALASAIAVAVRGVGERDQDDTEAVRPESASSLSDTSLPRVLGAGRADAAARLVVQRLRSTGLGLVPSARDLASQCDQPARLCVMGLVPLAPRTLRALTRALT